MTCHTILFSDLDELTFFYMRKCILAFILHEILNHFKIPKIDLFLLEVFFFNWNNDFKLSE